MPTMRAPPVAELEARIGELTLLMYDTSVPIPTLEARVYPHLAPDIEFLDPWVRARGRGKFETGLRGFHCVIRFDFEIFQLAVQLSPRGDGGRALVDGVMNLRQLRFYTYPLRTQLVYDFTLIHGDLQITRLEEMWSFGDMIAHAPLVGRLYDGAFRPAAGYFFTAMFWLSCALFGGAAWTRRRPAPSSRRSEIMADDKEDLKRQLEKILEELQTLGDEVRVRIHLAGLELKDKWNELEPVIDDLKRQKAETSQALHDTASSLRDALRALRDRLGS